jgi:AcrR family transcriptional regulator
VTEPARRADGRATAEQIVSVAERLFAERGVDAVSLREIGKAAASRNTAAAHYHFGGKPGLVRAIIARRTPLLNERRMELLARARTAAAERGEAVPPEELVRVLVVPLVEELDRGGHYVAFLARLATERQGVPWVEGIDEESARSFREVTRALAGALPGLDRRRFAHRSDLLVQLVVGALAGRQHAEASGARLPARQVFVDDLLEAATGLLLAPVGPGRADPRRADPPAAPETAPSNVRDHQDRSEPRDLPGQASTDARPRCFDRSF